MSSIDQTSQVICLLDMDCFYVQCEQKLQPDKWNRPCAVAQYNNWRGGGLIAVNYEARPFGVKRGMRGDEASKLCQDLHIFSVPDTNGKADLTRYRNASADVFDAITAFIKEHEGGLGMSNLITLERASVDEAYIDLTKYIDVIVSHPLPAIEELAAFNTKLECNGQTLEQMLVSEHVNQTHHRLILGAILVGKLRSFIYEKTQFRCSAGVSHNKMLAKLACSTNKPNAQTILPMEGVATFFQRISITNVRNLGGKLGQQVKNQLGINTMKELHDLGESVLMTIFDAKTAKWLHRLSCGIEVDPVVSRTLSKSIGCGKNFSGQNSLKNLKDIKHWVKVLAEELYTRLMHDQEVNKRFARSIIVGYHALDKGSFSRKLALEIIDEYPKPEKITSLIMKTIFPTNNAKFEPVCSLSLTASKFGLENEIESMGTSKINKFFKRVDQLPPIEVNDKPPTPKKAKTIDQPKLTTFFKKPTLEPDIPKEETNKSPKKKKKKDRLPLPIYDHRDNFICTALEAKRLKKSFFFRKIEEAYDQVKADKAQRLNR